MSITTFAGLIAYPNTQKIALAEISVSEAIIGTWTLHSGNVYKKTIGNESMTLPGGGTYNYLEEVSGLKYGSTTINTATAVADLATCLTTGSSWYQDVSASLLYVNFTGGNPNVDASLLPIMMSFPMRFATQGISLTVAAGARPFDPLIKNIPMISQINNQLAGGYATTAISSISMNNETGIFDQLLYGYIFEKRAITIRFGGESLPYSEYAIVFKGIIAGVEWTRMGVTFNLQSIQQVLAQTTMPSVTFDAAYPNIDPAFSGGMIPIAYGNFTTSGTPGRDSIKAIGEDEVTNIGVDTVKMRVAYNPLATVDKVSISYDNSVSWTVAALDAAALPTAANKYSTLSAIGGAAARFLDPRGITNDGTNLYVTDMNNQTIRKIVISSGVVTTYAGAAGIAGSIDGTGIQGAIWVRFTAATYDPAASKRPIVRVQFTGHYDGQGGRGYIGATGSEIIDNLLRSAPLSFTDDDIDTAAFATALINANGNQTVYLNQRQSIAAIINDICKGDAGFFYVNNAGKFSYAVWIPSRVTSITLTDEDILEDSLQIAFQTNEQFTVVRAGYNRSNIGDMAHLYKQNSASLEAAKYDNNASKTITTYLTGSSNADVLSQRMLYLHKNPLAYIRGVCKWQLGNCNVGDKIALTTSRAPYSGGEYSSYIIELTSIQKNFVSGTIAFEGRAIGGAGLNIGTVTADGYPSFTAATPAERNASGFVTDDYGYAEPGNPASLNISQIW